MLVCTMLAAVLSGGSPAIASPATHATSTGPMAWVESDDLNQLPRRQFGWPLPGSPTVVRAFQRPEFRYGPGHRGVDLATDAGTPVIAAGAGTVVFAGMVAGRGVVSLSHLGGLHTTYEPVSPTVAAGDRVSRGEQIGVVQPGQLSHPGCPVTVCLHWGVFHGPAQGDPNPVDPGKEYLDPLLLLITARVRLLPLDGPLDRPGDARTMLSGPEGTSSQPVEASSILLLSRSTALVCSWQTRDSVTPSTRPISASVRFSK